MVKDLLQCRRPRFDPWIGKIPWRRQYPVFLPGESHTLRSLVSYRLWGHRRVRHDWMIFTHTHTHTHKIHTIFTQQQNTNCIQVPVDCKPGDTKHIQGVSPDCWQWLLKCFVTSRMAIRLFVGFLRTFKCHMDNGSGMSAYFNKHPALSLSSPWLGGAHLSQVEVGPREPSGWFREVRAREVSFHHLPIFTEQLVFIENSALDKPNTGSASEDPTWRRQMNKNVPGSIHNWKKITT